MRSFPRFQKDAPPICKWHNRVMRECKEPCCDRPGVNRQVFHCPVRGCHFCAVGAVDSELSRDQKRYPRTNPQYREVGDGND